MKKTLLMLVAVCLYSSSFAQIKINPQLGIILMNYTDPPAGLEYSADAGFLLGGDVRIGGKFQFEPGAYYMATKTVTKADVPGSDPIESDITYGWIRVKAFAAYNFVDNETFRFRANGGPAYDILLSAKDEDDNDVKGDLNKGNFSLNLGLGIDVFFITFNVGYSYGLSRVLDVDNAPDSKYSGIYAKLGVVF